MTLDNPSIEDYCSSCSFCMLRLLLPPFLRIACRSSNALISSSLLPVFGGDYHSLILRKSKINTELFPIEKNYKIVFKLLGIGLTFLSFALISGFSLQSIFTANIVFKAIFTFIAWIIYIITMVGIKFFNFPIKYATRSLFLAMWAVLGAYFMNSYIIGS